MRNKFLGTGEAGYHPLRKLRTVLSGLRYAVLYDWSVTYKLVLSGIVLAGAFVLRAWVDFLLILVVTALVVFAEIVNSAIEALPRPCMAKAKSASSLAYMPKVAIGEPVCTVCAKRIGQPISRLITLAISPARAFNSPWIALSKAAQA